MINKHIHKTLHFENGTRPVKDLKLRDLSKINTF